MFYFKSTFTVIGFKISTILTYLFYVVCISNLHYTYIISKDFFFFLLSHALLCLNIYYYVIYFY